MKKLVIDSKLCTGCRYCEAICSFEHSDGAIAPNKARVRVRENSFTGSSITVACRQCAKPRCVDACPHFALRQDLVLGIPHVDRTSCRGAQCLACVQACPHGAMFFDHDQGLPVTCDLCAGDPACVKVCRRYPHLPGAALSYG